MEISEKIQICEIVAQAILSDGRITDEEDAFMTALMNKYELTDAQRQKVMQRNIDDDPAKLVEGITSFSSKNELVVELVLAIAADNELSKTEKELLGTVADAIGVDKSDLDMLVKNALM